MNEIFNLLKEAAERQKLPKAFKDDLYIHDKNRLEKGDLPSIFGWVLRDEGTYFIDIRMSKDSLQDFFSHFEENGSRHKYYIIFPEGKYMTSDLDFQDWKAIMENFNRFLSEDKQTGY
tara:strand:- start:84 stop:437 length:354 start_codon:yes stop_codon:yes gene_type:complete